MKPAYLRLFQIIIKYRKYKENVQKKDIIGPSSEI